MNKHMPILAYVIIGVVFGFAGYGFYSFFFQSNMNAKLANGRARNLMYTAPKNYDECISTEGSRSMESYPAVCVAPDGTRFTQPIPTNTAPSNLPD